ncbi:MAG: hypothetical protein KDA25_10690 [Phycisphaerales bacterium]|nr:hypothetical protein [Phycisphaerales bacterium]
MDRTPTTMARWVLFVLLAAGGSSATAQDAPSGESNRPVLDTLRRVVRHFDFEEAPHIPYPMPNYFYRLDDVATGFPRFGSMRLSDDRAAGGDWSFRFDLDGGSLAARIPSAVIPVLPDADYLVRAQIATAGLTHARARLVAWFHDHQGNIIEASRAYSAPILTNEPGVWTEASIALRGSFPDAADLALELQLVQADHLPQRRQDAGRPQFDDVSGTAWFDDVMVIQLPRVELSTDAPGNVVVDPEVLALRLLVRDLTQEALGADLRIFDYSGAMVAERSFASPRTSHPARIELPMLPFGWYRATLDLHNEKMTVATTRLDFVVAPALRRQGLVQDNRFGLVVREAALDELEMLPPLLDESGVGTAFLPVWSPEMTMESVPGDTYALRDMLDRIRSHHVDLVLRLDGVPSELAATVGVDATQVLDTLLVDPVTWRPYLEQILLRFGQTVSRWQIGNSFRLLDRWRDGAPDRAEQARRALSEFVPGPVALLPWPFDLLLPEPASHVGYVIRVGFEQYAAGLPELVRDWTGHAIAPTLILEPIPAEVYGVRGQAADLAMRALHAWREDGALLALESPWTFYGAQRRQVMPDPTYAVWRTLADRLHERRFGGELDLGDGLRCWILEGGGRPSALLAWNELAPRGRARIDALLSDGAVRIVDLFGNERRVLAVDGAHHIPLDDMPVFIEDIELALARFRGGIRLDPLLIPALHQVHESTIVLTNPFDVMIAGSVRLTPPQRWQVRPRIADFVIEPGESARVPIELVFQRSVESGRHVLDAEIDVQASEHYVVHMPIAVEVGHEHLHMEATWTIARNEIDGTLDVIVTQIVSNRGDRVMQLVATVIAPDVKQMRKPIVGLEPGQTVWRTFRIPNGAAVLSNKLLRVGVSERDGPAVLNRLLEIPELPTDVLRPPQRRSP